MGIKAEELALPQFGIIIAVAFALLILIVIQQKSVYFGYAFLLVTTFLLTASQNALNYFFVFCLGMMIAFAEILGKFGDEPIKALGTPHAVYYHLLNGCIAMLALRVLTTSGMSVTTPADQIKAIVTAGFGSMIAIRSKLFDVKAGEKEVAIGPEQVIRVYFQFMESAIDRVRARARIEFVRTKMRDIDFARVQDYSVTMLAAAQRLENKDDCIDAIRKIGNGSITDTRLRSFGLGFLLLNKMGEEFVAQLFDNPPPEWLVRAPMPHKSEGILGRLGFDTKQNIAYLAYGSSMSSAAFRRMIGWEDMEETYFQGSMNPRRGVLKGYRLVFNAPSPGEPHNCGLANLVADRDQWIEGVVYDVPKEALPYLDHSQRGYVRREISVEIDGKSYAAVTYFAETTRDGLKPGPNYLRILLSGGRDHGLSEEYLARVIEVSAAGADPPA